MMSARDNGRQIVSFWLKETVMGVPVGEIREILPISPVTPVQMAQPHIAGLVNLRGRIITLLDLAVLLGLSPVAPTELTHMIVLKHHEVGFWVDEIGDVLTPGTQEIAPVPPHMEEPFKSGVACLYKGPGEVVVVLDVPTLLSPLMTSRTGGLP